MSAEDTSFCQLQVEHLDIQTPLCSDSGVQLPERTGGCVAGIGHQGFPFQFPAGVDLFEHRARHIHLAPDDESGQLFRKCHGDRPNRAEVFRYILTGAAVTPGSASNEHTVPVFQRHRETVHLGLYRV